MRKTKKSRRVTRWNSLNHYTRKLLTEWLGVGCPDPACGVKQGEPHVDDCTFVAWATDLIDASSEEKSGPAE